ncbi:PREDICTED: uncharacterized protein LOC108550199 [Eufriesea mexicana]|uniref:uncharacterized protein LOC108550199 n=1 Tax=Eufriesea mexicana TaxID=516756 RepID=UPI00083C2E7F|nr:PREDICTED: uncharacterized protein LOC108550199 [Eufriesea mexicana]
MFESEDWDLDQEFLNDIDDKTVKYYSQKDIQESESKRRKIEINDDSILLSNCGSKEQNNINKTAVKHESKKSRTNLVLEILNKSEPNENLFNGRLNKLGSYDNHSSNIHVNCLQSYENSQLPRKNLVLEILKNKKIEDKITENNTKNVELKQSILKIKDEDDINEKSKNVIFNNKTRHQIFKSNSETENNLVNDDFKSKNLRKQLLCNMLQEQSTDSVQSNHNITKDSFSAIKHPLIQSNRKMTLVRKFPGPAGLLPDDLNFNIPCISYLNSLEENEKANKETDSNKLSEYCSQNTKNLFTEGAWQLMLDDLPHDFLKGHDIATIKQTANMNGISSTKVEFLAGIIEHIDYSHDNPPIILKDFTDNIQGIVHRDIPLKYPGFLETNVVVLLHDVGILRTSGTFVSNKYQILISPSNLLAIYTSTGTVERTQYMEKLFGNISEKKTKTEKNIKEDYIPAIANSQFIVKNSSNSKKLTNLRKDIKNINQRNQNYSINLNEADKNTDKSIYFDSNIFFSVSSNNITDSQNQKNFNCLTSKNLKHIKQEYKNQRSIQSLVNVEENAQDDDKEKAKNLLKSIKKFTSDVNKKKRLFHNTSISETNAEHSTSVNICDKEIESQRINDKLSEKMNIDKCSETICHKIVENKQEKNISSIRSKLLEFKNMDTLISSENSKDKVTLDLKEKHGTLSEEKLSEISGSIHDVLGDTENDSDDEMLSQLDMDIIFSNYNNKS